MLAFEISIFAKAVSPIFQIVREVSKGYHTKQVNSNSQQAIADFAFK